MLGLIRPRRHPHKFAIGCAPGIYLWYGVSQTLLQVYKLDYLARAKVIVLLDCPYFSGSFARRTRGATHISVSLHVVVVDVLHIFFDDKVAAFLNHLACFPADEAPAELGERGVVVLPLLKVNCKPRPDLFSPQRTHSLKLEASRHEEATGSFQPSVALVNGLKVRKRRSAVREREVTLIVDLSAAALLNSCGEHWTTSEGRIRESVDGSGMGSPVSPIANSHCWMNSS